LYPKAKGDKNSGVVSERSSALKQRILIIDLKQKKSSSELSRILEHHLVHNIIMSADRADKWLKINRPGGIILNGGATGLSDSNPATPDLYIFGLGIPILGICYGMQYPAYMLNGDVRPRCCEPQFGIAKVRIKTDNALFMGLKEFQTVLAANCDFVRYLPNHFEKIGWRENGEIMAMTSNDGKILGVQWRPEAIESPMGVHMLCNFVSDICKVRITNRPKAELDSTRTG
jgi:GMP synthase (glutamine-hydrolysing)